MRFFHFLIFVLFIQGMNAQFEVRLLHVVTSDLVYEPFSKKIYASITSANGANGNSLGIINPSTYKLEQTVFIGSEPSKLAVSDDGEYIYSGFSGSSTVRRMKLSTLSLEAPFSLGYGSLGPLFAEDLEVMPGNHDVVAVSRKMTGVSPGHSGVAVYDLGAMRPVTTQVHTGSNRIAFTNNPDWLFGYNNESTEFGLRRLKVDSVGIKEQGVFQNVFSGFGSDFIYHNDKLYSTNGKAVDVTNAPYLEGQFFSAWNAGVTFDAASNLVCYAISDWQGNVTFKRFDPQTFLVKDSLHFSNLSVSGTIKTMVNCGSGCYAFNTSDNQVVLINQSPVGLKEIYAATELTFYPNPVKELLHITGVYGIHKTIVTDIMGKIVQTNESIENDLNVSELPPGVYLLQLYERSGNYVSAKFVKD